MATKKYIIGEHTYETGNIPKKRDILFFDKPKEQQFWMRQEFPEIFTKFIPNFTELNSEATLWNNGILKSLNVQDSKIVIDLLLQEKDRRERGLWFYNNGEPEYMTGSHYFMLQWCKMYAVNASYQKFIEIFGNHIDLETFIKMYSEYGRYLKFQRDIFYLIDLVDNDSEKLGVFLTKAKKVGMTMLFACHYLNLSTSYRGKQMGQMSKKGEDAVKTNMLYFYHAFDGLPQIFKPATSIDARATGEIMFGVKSFRGSNLEKTALAKISQDEALNTRVFCAATKIKGFDAPVVFRAWLDEFPKMMQDSHVSPKAIFDTTQATLKFQNDINGKMYITSYTPEETDEGSEEAKKIYFESKLSTRKGKRRTTSELICYHVSSLYSYLSLIDKYGDCDEKEANNRIEESLENKKNDPKGYQALKRQLARDEREAWETGSSKSTFNVLALTQYLYKLEEELRDNPEPVLMGRLDWTNSLWEIGKKDRRPKGQFCPVKFIPISEEDLLDGKLPKFILYEKIPIEMQNLALKFGRDDYGNLLPPDRFNTITGIDPTQYAAGDEVNEGSKNALLAMNFHDEILNSREGKISSKIITGSYFYRPDAPSEAYEDLLKWIIWTGSLNVVEANAPYVATRLIEEGLINYMIVRNKDKVMCLGKSWMRIGEDFNLIRRTANQDQNDMLETLVRLITHYIEVIKDEPNYLETIKIVELIKQLINFDPKNTKVFDLVMAMGYMLLGYEIYQTSLFQFDNEYDNVRNFDSIFSALTVK